MKQPIFTGSAVAIITPFQNESVDYEALGKLLQFQLSSGTDAIVICGTTHSGNDGRLVIVGDHCIFCGQAEDLSEVLNGRCPERGCRQNGREGIPAW